MQTVQYKFPLILMITAALLCGITALTWGNSAELVIQSDTVNVGDSVQLSLAVQGTTSAAVPKINTVKGLEIHYMGPSTQIQIVNGRLSQSVTYNFLVNALQPGKYTLGPYTVQAGSRKITTNSLVLTVIGAHVAGSGNASAGTSNAQGSDSRVPDQAGKSLFLTLSVPRTRLYLGEEVPATIKLYVGDVKVDELSYPRLNQSEFVTGKMPEPEKTREIVNGAEYQVLTFQTKITPVKTGDLVLGPVQMSCTKLVLSDSSDPFGNFFSDYVKQPVALRSKPMKITVAELPTDGKPQNFSGGIGQYQMNVTAGPTSVLQGDPITVKMHVGGDGNMQTIAPPQLQNAAGLKVYDAVRKSPASADSQSVDPQSATGADFEQIVIPVSPSVKQIGPYGLTYFDPAAGRYRDLIVPAIPVTVKPNPNFKPDTVLGGGTNPDKTENLGRDLIYIKNQPGRLTRISKPLANQPLFWILQIIPCLGLICSVAYRKRYEMLQADTPEARSIRAVGKAAKELEKVKKALDESKTDGILDDLHRIIREYLAEKYNLPAAGMTQNVVGDLKEENVDAQILKAIGDFFAGYDFYRFTGSRLTAETGREFFEKVQTIVQSLNDSGGIPRRPAQRGVMGRNGEA